MNAEKLFHAEDRGKPPLQGRDRGFSLVPRDDFGIGDGNASSPPFDDAPASLAKIEHPMRLLAEGERQQEAALDPDAGEWGAEHATAAATAVLEDDIQRDVSREAQDHGVENARGATEDSMVRVGCSHVHHAKQLIDGGPDALSRSSRSVRFPSALIAR